MDDVELGALDAEKLLADAGPEPDLGDEERWHDWRERVERHDYLKYHFDGVEDLGTLIAGVRALADEYDTLHQQGFGLSSPVQDSRVMIVPRALLDDGEQARQGACLTGHQVSAGERWTGGPLLEIALKYGPYENAVDLPRVALRLRGLAALLDGVAQMGFALDEPVDGGRVTVTQTVQGTRAYFDVRHERVVRGAGGPGDDGDPAEALAPLRRALADRRPGTRCGWTTAATVLDVGDGVQLEAVRVLERYACDERGEPLAADDPLTRALLAVDEVDLLALCAPAGLELDGQGMRESVPRTDRADAALFADLRERIDALSR